MGYIIYDVYCAVCVSEHMCGVLPAGAKAFSVRSALILLLSEEGRHWVLPGRLSTLPPLDRGRLRKGSGWRERREKCYRSRSKASGWGQAVISCLDIIEHSYMQEKFPFSS